MVVKLSSEQEEPSTSNDSETEIDTRPPAPILIEGEHSLQNSWSFWYMRRVQGSKPQENYEKNIKPIGAFTYVEGFWRYYNHLMRPNDLPVTSDYHLFKHSIKPLWEDEANKNGGKWIVRLRKGLASRFWEDLILSIIGEQFGVGDEICGVVISIRFQEDIISIWNKTSTDRDAKMKIHERMKQILHSVPSLVMEYKGHNESLRDHSSFRNTDQALSLLYQKQRKEKLERTERSDRSDRTERSDRSDRTERSERTDRTERTDRFERVERKKIDRSDRFERSERVDKGERIERPERTDKLERTERPERSERTERPERTERTERSERPERLERSDKVERPERQERVGI